MASRRETQSAGAAGELSGGWGPGGDQESQISSVNRTGKLITWTVGWTVIIDNDVVDPLGQIGVRDRLERPACGARTLY